MEGLVQSSKQLDEDNVRVALWSTLDGVLSLVAVTLIERRSLEAMRCENHLCAPATKSLRLCCFKKCASQALPSMTRIDPEV